MKESQIKDVCSSCGGDVFNDVFTPNSPHYAKRVCSSCSTFHSWLKKPEDDSRKNKRPQSHRGLVKKFSSGICEMCLRTEFGTNETLEAHHVKRYKDGGAAVRENIWILCTGCHKLVHWRRNYIQ